MPARTQAIAALAAALAIVPSSTAQAATPVSATVVVHTSAGGLVVGRANTGEDLWGAPKTTFEFQSIFAVRGGGEVAVYSPQGVVRWIDVTAPGWRTSKGVHRGTSVAALRRAYPRRLKAFDGCSNALSNGLSNPAVHGYVLDASTKARTIFETRAGKVRSIVLTQRKIRRDTSCKA